MRKATKKSNGKGIIEDVSPSDVLSELERAGIVDEEQVEMASQLVRLRNQLSQPVQRTSSLDRNQTATRQYLQQRASQIIPLLTNRKPTKKPTAEVLASRKLQGRYISMLVKVPKSQRKRFQKIAKEQSREVAIRQMAKALR